MDKPSDKSSDKLLDKLSDKIPDNIYVTSNNMFFEDDEKFAEKISVWNSVVRPADLVYVLGNFAVDPVSFLKVGHCLNGEKVFLIGEYDSYLHDLPSSSMFANNPYRIINKDIILDDCKCVLSHYPYRYWHRRKDNYCNVYGYATAEVNADDLTASACINQKFGNKPINLNLLIEILNKKI